MSNKWSIEEDEILKENFISQGKLYCKQCLPDRTLVAIQQRATLLKLTVNNSTPWLQEDIVFIKNNYSREGAQYCADFLNRPVKLVRQKANRLGLKQENIFKGVKRDFSEIYNLNNPKIVYLLGLIWADGHIGKNSISIYMVSSDFDELLNKLDILNLLVGCSIKHKRPQKENWQPQTLLTFGNTDIANFLKDNGYIQSRILEPCILNLIPDHLKHYWFRGLLDGDGSYVLGDRRPAISITGNSNSTYAYLESLLADYLNVRYRIICAVNKSGSKYSRVIVSGIKNTQIFVNYLYQDWVKDNLGLTRKYLKSLEISNLNYLRLRTSS